MSLSVPAKPPVPAKIVLEQTQKKAVLQSSLPARPKFWLHINKKVLAVSGATLLGLLIFFSIVNSIGSFFKTKSKPQQAETLTPTPVDSSSPIDIMPTVVQDIFPTIAPDRQNFFSDQGGFQFNYQTALTLGSSTDVYKTLQPFFFSNQYYFDCINRQVGSLNPFPCWLMQIKVSTVDTINLDSKKIDDLLPPAIEPKKQFVDALNRTWQIAGPVAKDEFSIIIANRGFNGVTYQLETKLVRRSLKEFILNNPDRPLGLDSYGTEDSQLLQAHEAIVQNWLSTWQFSRKPFIQEPTWGRHRFNDNWSVAYPQNWELFSPDEAPLASSEEGLLQGWYGNGNSVSFHLYSVKLITPVLSQYPDSALKNIDTWVKYEKELLTETEQKNVNIIQVLDRQTQRGDKRVIVLSRLLLDVSDNSPFYQTTDFPDRPVHKAYIWEKDDLPPRIVLIRQLDGGYESKPMKDLLDTFVKRIYE